MSGDEQPHTIGRRQFLNWWSRPLLLVAAMPLLQACGSPTPTPTTAPAKPTEAPKLAAAPPAGGAAPAATTSSGRKAPQRQQEAATPVRGGILPSALGKDPENLLIMHYVNGPLRISTNFCYRRLVQFRALDYWDVEVEPDMADSWEISEDGKTYTFHLHPGIKWHNIPPVNGREFTSADVAWTIEYYKTKNSEYGWLYDWVADWETPDKYTIVMRAEKPYAEALMNLAVDNSVILAKEVFDQDGSYRQRVVGTGPFIWTSWEPGVKVEVRRNPDYWEVSELDGKPLPYLDGLDLFIIPDYAGRLAAFKTGRVNGNRWGFQPELKDVDGLLRDMPKLRRWDGVHYLSGGGLILNVSKPPFNDVRVRRAASMAINRDALIKDVVDGKGEWMSVIASSFKGVARSQDQIRQHPNLQYNPDEARRLIKEAGVDGLAFPVNGYTTAGVAKVVLDMVEQMWKSVGLNPSRDMTDIPTSYQKRVTGDFAVLGEGVGFTSASLDAATRQLYHSKGERNYGRVSDPQLDDLAQQQFGEMDVKKRSAIVDKIQERVLDQMWTIPTYTQFDTLLDHNWVVNKPWHWQLAWAYPERIWYDRSRPDV